MRLTLRFATLLVVSLTLAGCRHASLESSTRPLPSDARTTVHVAASDAALRYQHGKAPYPPPTLHVLEQDSENTNKKARKAWWAQMHRAAPGVDWKSIERENGARQASLRRALRLRKGVEDGSWTERGSRNQAGRMHAMALSLDGSTLYGGSALGGVWRGTLTGEGWQPISDHLFGGCHGLAVGASPTETLTATTNWGRVVYTVDDGLNWEIPTGLTAGINRVYRVAADPTDPSRIYLLTRRAGIREFWRSEDGGLSYTLVRSSGNVPTDFWLDRLTGAPLYLLEGEELVRSDDNGDSWNPVGTIPGGGVEDVRLAASEAGAPSFYGAVARGGVWQLYRSQNGGLDWTYRSDLTDFWGQMTASIGDPDLVVTGGVEVRRSDDGGQTFDIVNGWAEYYGDPENKLHADIMGLVVTWTDGAEVFWVGTDGGVYRSDDRLQTVQNLSLESLRVSQYYSTHTSVTDPELIIAGSQDQGYQRSYGPLLGDGQAFDQIISGDYANLTSTDGTHEWLYSVYPGFILVHRDEANPWLTLVDFPPGETHPWLPFVYADPLDREAFFFCARHLYRYKQNPMNGDWEFTQALAQDFTVAGGNALSVMSSSPIDPNLRIAATDSGHTWYSTDGGTSFTVSPDQGPSSFYLYGSALEFSPLAPLTAYLGGSGYSGPGVYRTLDGGQTWSAVGDGLPRTMVYDLVFESDTSEVVYAATEAGPYALPAGSDTWVYIGGTSAPLTSYFSVEAVPAADLIRYGTYGRGIWDYTISTDPESGDCADAVDNDRDGLTDCADPECSEDDACPEDCANGVDDDADGRVDCDDDECHGDASCPESDHCADREDNDADGLVDCLDPDCSDDDACPEDCRNGIDDDADGDADCDDAECVSIDSDGDGSPDCVDCAPGDPGTWATAPDLSLLTVGRQGTRQSDVVLSWSDEAVTSGLTTGHDVFLGRLTDLHRDRGLLRGSCVANDLAGRSYADPWTILPGQVGYWYLIRADNSCSVGTLGLSSEAERSLPAGPCD